MPTLAQFRRHRHKGMPQTQFDSTQTTAHFFLGTGVVSKPKSERQPIRAGPWWILGPLRAETRVVQVCCSPGDFSSKNLGFGRVWGGHGEGLLVGLGQIDWSVGPCPLIYSCHVQAFSNSLLILHWKCNASMKKKSASLWNNDISLNWSMHSIEEC